MPSCSGFLYEFVSFKYLEFKINIQTYHSLSLITFWRENTKFANSRSRDRLKIKFFNFNSFLRLLKMPAEAKPVLRFAKLSEHAFEPVKGSEKAAGFDLKR